MVRSTGLDALLGENRVDAAQHHRAVQVCVGMAVVFPVAVGINVTLEVTDTATSSATRVFAN